MGQQTGAPPAHPAASPATANGGGGEGGAAAAVTPAWSRPDDASRQAQLDALKRRAPRLPALAAAVGLAARRVEAQRPRLRPGRREPAPPLSRGRSRWVCVTGL